MVSQVQQHRDEQAVEKLSSNLRGDVVLPGDAAYETERKVWNGLYDHYPAAIVRCVDAEDVRIAVNFARELGMTLSLPIPNPYQLMLPALMPTCYTFFRCSCPIPTLPM